MEFHNILVQNPARLKVENSLLVIQQDESYSIPMEDISSLLIESQQVMISAAALQQLTDSGVTVYFCDSKHMPAAVALPINRHSRQLKMLQKQVAMSVPLKKRLWRDIVCSKINNQARCLDLTGSPGGDKLRYLASQVRSGDPDNHEANAAAYYFPLLFGSGFIRGSDSIVNAALNYGYAIVRGAIARNLVMYGLEPCLGINHHSSLNQFNLADDLIEPYRPIVDLMVAGMTFDSECELTPRIKQKLFTVTNHLIALGEKNFRVISAIGQSVISLTQSILSGKCNLSLPTLIELKEYRNE